MRWSILTLSLVAACSPNGGPGALPASGPNEVPGQAAGPDETTEAATPALNLDCLVFRAEIYFKALPEIAQHLEATYQGDEQAQWRFLRSNGQDTDRMLRYRSGERIYMLDPGSDRSHESTGADRTRVLAQFELRRAMYLWPDGFDWQPTPRGQEVSLPGGGALVAALQADTPAAFFSLLPGGGEFERFQDLSWREFHGRRFVSGATLRVEGQEIWRESLREVVQDCEYTSYFFLPPDRRALDTAESGDLGVPRHQDLPARFERKFALPSGLDWEAACAEGERQRQYFREAFPALAERLEVAYALDEDASPQAVLMRLDEAGAEGLPQEESGLWSLQPAGPALSLLVPSTASLTPGKLQALAERIPEGRRPGVSHVRFSEGAQTTVQLVLRLQSP